MPYMDSIDKSMWAPVIDGVELTDSPPALLERGAVADVPILLGTNRDEGSTFTANQTGHGQNASTASSMYDHWMYGSRQLRYHLRPSLTQFQALHHPHMRRGV